MKRGNVTGPDKITIETLGDLGSKVITELLNDIYNTGYIYIYITIDVHSFARS